MQERRYVTKATKLFGQEPNREDPSINEAEISEMTLFSVQAGFLGGLCCHAKSTGIRDQQILRDLQAVAHFVP